MFGSIAWMVHGNMAGGVLGDEVIVRLSVEDSDHALAEPDTRPFDMTGRSMRGFVVVVVVVGGGRSIAHIITASSEVGSTLEPTTRPRRRRSERRQ